MELNRQRTVSGLALPPRSPGAGGWERSRSALQGARHRPGSPPDTSPPPPAAQPPRAAASLCSSGHPAACRDPRRGGTRQRRPPQQHPRFTARNGAPQTPCGDGHSHPNPLPLPVHTGRDSAVLENSSDRGSHDPGPKAAACARLLVTGMIVTD